MAFHVGMDYPVEWIFARDLLAAGLSGPAGEGDVRLWPSVEPDRSVLNISLSSPYGQAQFEAPLAALTRFLLRTFEVVPEGREEEFIDTQDELNDLLR